MLLFMQACGIPWGHGIRKQPVNVATGGLHSCLSFSFHFSFPNDYEISAKTMSPCQVSIYYRLRPPHSISIMGKGKCVAPIDRLTLFDICFISCSDCHSLRAFSTARSSQHSSYLTRMGLLVKCGLAALRRHLALPPYESSIRVLKVREFVNSIFPVYI
mgnify:FL=1